jgi:hypothetical protein
MLEVVQIVIHVVQFVIEVVQFVIKLIHMFIDDGLVALLLLNHTPELILCEKMI